MDTAPAGAQQGILHHGDAKICLNTEGAHPITPSLEMPFFFCRGVISLCKWGGLSTTSPFSYQFSDTVILT